MKTFAQTKGQAFNWNKFLAKRPSNYTQRQRNDAETKAGEWVTCACGNQCSIIPRDDSDGEPQDPVLYKLGMEFSTDVSNANDNLDVGDSDTYKHARRTLAKIEKRSAFLIKQEQQNLIKKLVESGFRGTIE